MGASEIKNKNIIGKGKMTGKTNKGRKFVIGLTGGIGAGKSTVSEMLAQNGATIIDADKIGHEIYEPGSEANSAIRKTFGDEYFDAEGRLIRPKLGALVFSDEQALLKLNSIVHPAIVKLTSERAAQADGIVIVDAALLIEVGLHDICDAVWLVTVREDVRIERVMKRNGFTEQEVRDRINSQISDAERGKYASVVLDNSGGLPELREQILRALADVEEKLA